MASQAVTMIVTPKPVSRDVKSNQTLRDNVEKPIHDPDYASSESEDSTTTVAPNIGCGEKKVGIWHCMCQW
jgi:hypothetical protein